MDTDTIVESHENFESHIETHEESETTVPENSDSDQPKSKEPNDVYKGLSQGFTLVFDSKTMLNKPKSRVTTPTTPTTPTRKHQRTPSITSNKIWTENSESPVVKCQDNETVSEKLLRAIDENNINDIISQLEKAIKEDEENIPNEKNNKEDHSEKDGNKQLTEKSLQENSKVAECESEIGKQEKITKISVKPIFKSSNGRVRNGRHKKLTQSFILEEPNETPLWRAIISLIYFHFTAAIGIFLVLSSQVMWQTIAFTLGLHLLSAFGLSASSVIKPFIPPLYYLDSIFDVLTKFAIPAAIPWLLWSETIVASFLVVSQIGYCLHWYGTWFSARKEKSNKYKI